MSKDDFETYPLSDAIGSSQRAVVIELNGESRRRVQGNTSDTGILGDNSNIFELARTA